MEQVTPYRPRFSVTSVLSFETVQILELSDSVEMGLVGRHGDMALNLITSNNNSYQIPEIMTSKGTLEFLGFTPSKVEEIWSDNNPARGILKHATHEFIEGILYWIENKIDNIKWFNNDGELKTPKELLDTIGLRPEVQLQPLKLTSLPERDGVRVFCLQQLHSECVLVWAKRYIARRWSLLDQLDDLICYHDDNWRQRLTYELSERPIDSVVAFSDSYVPLPIQRLGFDGF